MMIMRTMNVIMNVIMKMIMWTKSYTDVSPLIRTDERNLRRF